MHILTNFPIRYKLLSGFFLIWIVLLFFVIHLSISFNKFYQSFATLDTAGDKRILFSTLNTNTIQLSDAIKSYMLTKNQKWEKTYDTTSIEIQNNLSSIQKSKDNEENQKLTEFKQTLTRLQGVELLILAKTKEGDTSEAIKLFDTYYESQQEHLVNLSDELAANEDKNFDEALANNKEIINNTEFALGLIVIIVLFLAILIGYYFSLIIEKPLNKLLESMKKMTEGDLSVRAAISSHDEIGRLAFSFNTMAEQLQQSYNDLEAKVQTKTKELSEKVGDLENTKSAMINVMEDLQKEKSITEQEKIKDEAILESIGDGMLVADNTGRVLLMNYVAQQMLMVKSTEYYKRNAYELFHLQLLDGTPVPEEKRPLFVALRTKKKITETFTIVTHNENERKTVISITATPVVENNTIIGVVEILHDVTKEKEIDRMKTEFISLASHQLRTPLSAIKWFSEMLIGGDAGKLTTEQQDFAQNIYESTERMIELVNSLLNISRIESGRIMIDPKPTALKELVETIVKELRVKIDQKQQNLIISVHGDLPKVNLDPKLIRQVYINLLTNAIKYTPKGGDISVFISKKDDQIISQVTDTGYGIPKAEHAKLFQKFFRATNIIKVETDGTGLGLYLIKAIIESSHGKIWFVSEENKGTTFWFSLPMTGMEAKKGEVTLDE